MKCDILFLVTSEKHFNVTPDNRCEWFGNKHSLHIQDEVVWHLFMVFTWVDLV